MILNILSVMALAVLEHWSSIPLGFVLGLHPVIIAIANIIGATLGVLIIVFTGERLRNYILKHHKSKNEEKKPGIMQKIWNRYGVIGLGLLAPLLTGASIGSALGIALGAPAKKLLLWMSLGIILWTIILVLLGVAGVEVFT
jgi:membrane protein DedA with SNARE-associated domain